MVRVPEYGKADVRFASEGDDVLLEDEPERPVFEGNRRARRKAAAQARKDVYVMPPGWCRPTSPDIISVPRGQVVSSAGRDAARLLATKAILASELTVEWMRVQDLQGRIIDMATPKERAAREAACEEEWRRIEALERAAEESAGKPAPCRDRDLPAVGSFA